MKNLKVLLSIMGIFIVSILLVVIIKNNTKEFILYDGTLLALTIDGSTSSSFPTDTNKYHVDIECDGGVGEYLPDDDYNMKFTIKDITKDEVKCFVDFTTISDNNKSDYLLKTKVESDNPTNNNGYRYNGKQPNNWVWFNNELWRIIGSVPVVTENNIAENKVKIIRDESIGSLIYGSGEFDTNNTLYKLLNEYYYGKKNATGGVYCYSASEASGLCDYSVIGISSDIENYYGKMVLDVFMYYGDLESSYPTVSKTYIKETSTLSTITSKIMIMYASDYAYAGSSTGNIDEISASKNWLCKYDGELTMTLYGSNSRAVMQIDIAGDLYAVRGTDIRSNMVRPTLYLDSNVYIISGNGTENNPYILGM